MACIRQCIASDTARNVNVHALTDIATCIRDALVTTYRIAAPPTPTQHTLLHAPCEPTPASLGRPQHQLDKRLPKSLRNACRMEHHLDEYRQIA